MDKNTEDIIKKIIDKHGISKNKTIPILQDIQKEFNYLPENILYKICELTEISQARIIGVATFYNQFRHFPTGKHLIKVCVGTACHVKGAMKIYDAFYRYLHLTDNQDTDKDGFFTIQQVSCLGCCTLAPVVQIDDITYGNVNQNDVSDIIYDFINNKTEQESIQKELKKEGNIQGEIRLGLGSCCIASGSEEIKSALTKTIDTTGINVKIKHVGCVGMCHQVPLLEVIPDGKESVTYSKVKPENVNKILLSNFKPKNYLKKIKNSVVSKLEYLYLNDKIFNIKENIIDFKDKHVTDFLNKQVHIATEYKGEINPLDIEEYKSHNGFLAFTNCINSNSQKEIIDIIKKSGLKGRGGAGFPTGEKWEIVYNQLSDIKYIICNGDEGDPGAFMDRMLLESFPYRIIEGMLIAAFAIGASKGYFYIRAEYPLAVERINEAIIECKKHGYIGKNILNSNFSLEIEIFQGAGAFVCGEETALISSIQGSRGMPRIRPPFPSESGLFKKPTLVNNTETLASIPWIIRNGADEYNKIGTFTSKGTKVFALAGKVARGGLIEVPMGISINEIVNEIGSGIQNNKKFKALQIGGPSGGCIPASLGYTPIDYHYLNEIGAMMGSGGLVVLDETDCIVDIAHYFLSFTQSQSCGKCVFCRVGTKQMLHILEKFISGKGDKKDLETLEELTQKVKKGSLCGLGKSAPNPVITSLKYFKEEYDAHINGKCPAKKCKNLITYYITDTCIGCTKCSQNCPVDAIEFKPYEKHIIDVEKCIKCDICKQVCPNDSVKII